MFASLVVIMVPVLIFIFAVQEYMVRGLVSLGGFKK
jgi:ABC-type glycerol-3-phosphate transport system permease component